MAKVQKSYKPKLVYKKKTSIGHSKHSRPTNKHARRSFKPYRGQG